MNKVQKITQSIVEQNGTTYALVRDEKNQKALWVHGDATGFTAACGELEGAPLYALNPQNAATLRQRLPWLNPSPLGLNPSAGTGDRLGLATPGHIWAVRETKFSPILAQQSVRENVRTGRTPQQVLDDAMWGVFAEGWKKPWGADADHLKNTTDLQPFLAAGYSFFTIDPGEHVDSGASGASLAELQNKAEALPWAELQSSLTEMKQTYCGKTFHLQGLDLTFSEETLLRAMVKYSRAVLHASRMNAAIREGRKGQAFDLEVSVDETDSPTTILEHFFIASELKRLGVEWVSLAPRFCGRFEKGVDYLGDLNQFEAEMKQHAAIMAYFGHYKISLHSGSDKFSIYPIVSRYVGNLVHLKTAGTSYLEALRVLALYEPALFKQIYQLGIDRYETDCVSYHVSAQLSKVPALNRLSDADLPALLDQFDVRQVLHVTFGSALNQFRAEILGGLVAHEAAYAEDLQNHFRKHLQLFQIQ